MTIGEIVGLMLLIFIPCGAYFTGWQRGYNEGIRLSQKDYHNDKKQEE